MGTHNLADRQETCLELHEAGMSTRQIGKRLGISHTMAGQHIRRARKRLAGIPATVVCVDPAHLDRCRPLAVL
ncbi:MAG: sigma factor-like helix-turn-helix DNA-binding protein [Phycisphaerae bacterium]